MKLTTFLILSALFISVSCKLTKVTPKTDDEKTLYAMGGMLFGQRLKSLDLSERELDYLLQGVRDSIKGKDHMMVDMAEEAPKMRGFIQQRGEKVLAVTKEMGSKFVEKFMIDEGDSAKKTDSGLVYKIIEEGVGDKPTVTDTVVVKYKGQLVDGTVFDENQEGVEFPLNGVIKGWSEGVQFIAPGGKIKLVIPPEIGYGDGGTNGPIPGGSTLVFDVELVEIKAPEPAKEQPAAK